MCPPVARRRVKADGTSITRRAKQGADTMKATRVGRRTRRGLWSAAILGVVTAAVVGTGIWAGTTGAATGAAPRGSAPAARQSTQTQTRAAAGTAGGIITMRQGNMEMAMTRLSGKAPTWA